MAQIGMTPTLTFGGNGTERLVGSIAEVQLKKILTNALSNEFVFKATATARSIQDIAGVVTAVYRIANRKTWGVKYDLNLGAEKQTGSGNWGVIQVDKTINIKFDIEDYDINAFLEGNTQLRTNMISEWITSITTNLLQNMELIFRRAVQDYCIARYKIDKTSIMIFDPSKIKNEDEAKQFFTDFGLKMVDKIRTIDETMIGTNIDDWIANFSMKGMKYLTKAFTNLVGGDIAANTLVSGKLYENSIFGLPIAEDFWLDDSYDKASARGMNVDCTYDLTGTISQVLHTDAWAFPMGFSYFRQMLDPATGNLRWIGKHKFALPCNLRPLLTFIIRTKEPTAEEILSAIKKGKIGSQSGGGSEFDLETYTYQVVDYDALSETIKNPGSIQPTLSSLITETNLGELADNKEATIISAVKSKNTKAPANLKAGSITDTKATLSSTDASGTVEVAFTKK